MSVQLDFKYQYTNTGDFIRAEARINIHRKTLDYDSKLINILVTMLPSYYIIKLNNHFKSTLVMDRAGSHVTYTEIGIYDSLEQAESTCQLLHRLYFDSVYMAESAWLNRV